MGSTAACVRRVVKETEGMHEKIVRRTNGMWIIYGITAGERGCTHTQKTSCNVNQRQHRKPQDQIDATTDSPYSAVEPLAYR